MSPTIRHKYKYFYSTVQRAKDRQQKFHFCRLPFDVRPRNVKLNLSNNVISSTTNPHRPVIFAFWNSLGVVWTGDEAFSE